MKTLATKGTRGLTASSFDFRKTNKVGPTPGWIPFVFLIAIVPVLLGLMLVAGYLILG